MCAAEGCLMVGLSVETILEVERRFPKHSGWKEEAVRSLGVTPARYEVLLGRALETPEAARLDPILVRRLRARRKRALQTQVARIAGVQ